MEPSSIPPGRSDPFDDPSDDVNPSMSMGMHITTFIHEGRFWDVHLEFVEEARDLDPSRARLCYVPTDQADHEDPVRTAVIIIEPTRDEALRAAGALDRHHLAALLRSAI